MRDAISKLADAGFDLVHAFDAHDAARVPGWEVLAPGPRLGVLIGNTRALWPRFVAALSDGSLAGEPNPLEHYTEHTIASTFPTTTPLFVHRRYGGAFLPFQRLAIATGLGALAPSQLVIHPIYGPWFALRAVITLDGDPPARQPIAQPCTCDAACGEALANAIATTPPSWRAWLGVRETCALRAWRYSDEQIAYHYTRAFPGAGQSQR
ncbi:MAG: hypothetical protein AB7P03_00775 [Kofleriaceae bacterium]